MRSMTCPSGLRPPAARRWAHDPAAQGCGLSRGRGAGSSSGSELRDTESELAAEHAAAYLSALTSAPGENHDGGQLQAVLPGGDGGGNPVHALDHRAVARIHGRLHALQRVAPRAAAHVAGAVVAAPEGP